MTEAQAIEAVLQQWNTAWTALNPTVPWHTGNEPGETGTTWVRIEVLPSTANHTGLGAVSRFTRRGFVAVQCFVPVHEGDGPLAALCDDVRACLEGKRCTLPGVAESAYIYAGSSYGKSTDGAWRMQTVTFPIVWDELRATG